MRDDHLAHYHFRNHFQACDEVSELEEEDLKHICFDLVRADDVEGMRSILKAGKLNSWIISNDLIGCAAQYSSLEMLSILMPQKSSTDKTFEFLFRGVAQGDKRHLFEHFLNLNKEEFKSNYSYTYYYYEAEKELGLVEVLRNGSHEMLDIMCQWIEQDVLKGKKRAYLASASMISATSGDTYREQILLSLWRKVPKQCWNNSGWKNAITNVASTTCSVELTKFLLGQFVPVDWRQNTTCLTALLHATKKDTAEAADLAKLLLFNGASTVVPVGNPISSNKPFVDYHVSKGKGAQKISRWLGVTWDELVAQVQKARWDSEDLDNKEDNERDEM